MSNELDRLNEENKSYRKTIADLTAELFAVDDTLKDERAACFRTRVELRRLKQEHQTKLDTLQMLVKENSDLKAKVEATGVAGAPVVAEQSNAA